ncbi:MAG: TDE2508 family outer membrane beta-barrel protein [Treponema sp.]
MKLVKKIALGAAVGMTAAGLAFADDAGVPSGMTLAAAAADGMEPQSMLFHSTAELFGNDVDDFMNVNEYHNVQPEKIFGYLSYGDDGKSAINFGLAHQFNQFYLAGWFGGRLNEWSITKTNKESSSQDDTVLQHDSTGAVYGKILFGIGNMGIMANFAFKPESGNSYSDNRNNKTKTTNNKFNLNTSVKFGINLDAGGKLYKTWAELGVNSRIAKDEMKTNGELTTFKDGSIYQLNVNGGTSFDVYEANDITQTIDLELDTAWDFYATKYGETSSGKQEQNGAFNMEVAFKPAWTLAYEPEDSKFGFKTKVGLDNIVKYRQDYDKDIGASTMYNNSRKYYTEYELTPSLAVGAIYKVVPEKFQFNGGGTFAVSTGRWTTDKTEIRNSADGRVLQTDEIGKWEVKNGTGKLGLKSGFTWTPSEKVTIDAYWNVLEASLGGNISSVFSKNFGFLVAVKL